MLKITRLREDDLDVLLKLEGSISGQWAALLDGECRSFLRRQKAVGLDCANVVYIDARGIEVLTQLPHPQVTLISTPSFVADLLKVGANS